MRAAATCLTRLAILLALVLAGCAAPPGGRVVGTLVGDLAPDVSVQPVDGPAWNLSAHRGQVVVIDLMGVNCPPCREEMPRLVAFTRNHANDTEFAFASVDMATVYPGLGARNVDEIRNFKAQFNATWPFAPDPGDVGARYSPIALPVKIVIDPQGVIRAVHSGGVITAAQLEQDVAQARGG